MSERLIKQGCCIILPDNIDSDAYSDFLCVVLNHLKDPVYVFIEGNGGNSSQGFAIADTIKLHGNVTGILTGSAMSAHATVFAACQKRYAFPTAAIGVHQCGWAGEMDIDANRLRLLLEEFTRVDDNTIYLMAKASNIPVEVWRAEIDKVGNRDFFMVTAADMIEHYDMAKNITELDTKWLLKAQQLKKSKKLLPTKTS